MEIQHSKLTEAAILNNTPASMVFQPEKESLAEWQKRAEEKLIELTGFSEERCELLFEKEYESEHDTFTEIRFTFQSEEGEFVPCHLWLPKETEYDKPPVMICLQGHSTGMHISMGRIKHPGDESSVSSGDRDFAVQCIENGMAAVSLEQRCFGERGGNPRPDCYEASMRAILTGRTIIGGRVKDIMCLIDVLEDKFNEIINTDAIYCMGNSGGGTATFYAAALEKRIKAAIPSCAFATFKGSIGAMYHCACNYIPGIAKYFDMAEIAGLIAPRPLVIVSGKEDGIFPLDTAQHEFSRLKEIYYKNSEFPENCVHVIGSEGHRFYKTPSWDVFRELINK